MPLEKQNYPDMTEEEVIKEVEDVCSKMSVSSGREVHISGLPSTLIEKVRIGLPRLRYWKMRQPATWLTNEEANFSEDQLDTEDSTDPLWDVYLSIVRDPVKWVEWEFGIVCRPQQAEILRSDAKKVVFRISRRCGKTWALIMLMLWYIYTHENAEVILLTPSEMQLDNIFSIIRNDFLAAPLNRHFKTKEEGGIVTSMRKKPSYYLEVESIRGASRIVGNICSHSVRGKGGKNCMLVFDEFDWIEDESAIKSSMVIATQNPDIRTVIASTASGKKGLYYKFCTDPIHGYEEHRWSVWEGNMVWDIETAIQESMKMSWNEYIQEYEAGFGDEATGWIPKELVDEICSWPAFEDGSPGSDYYDNRGTIDGGSPIRTMGVDWDKMGDVGPSIVITELDRRIQKMRVVHSETIDKSIKGFTLGNAVRRIIELNELYNPHFIYCDRGYGERQVEELHEYGELHPETGLAAKVYGIHFGEKIQVHDYVSNEVIKKPVKQVMAADMRQWFYERRVIISRYRADLRRQLENFRVVKTTQQGYRFNEDDEHLVDAFMLSIHAISVHFDELFQKLVPPVIMNTGVQLSDMYSSPVAVEQRHANDMLMNSDVAPAVYHVGYKPVQQGRLSKYYDGPGVNMPSRPPTKDWGRGGGGWGR